MISFRYKTPVTVLSTTYHVQKMFATHHGDTPIGCSTSNSLFICESKDSSTNTYYIKFANYNPFNVSSDAAKVGQADWGTLTTLAARNEYDCNTDTEPQKVVPETRRINVDENGSFKIDMPAWSVAVWQSSP